MYWTIFWRSFSGNWDKSISDRFSGGNDLEITFMSIKINGIDHWCGFIWSGWELYGCMYGFPLSGWINLPCIGTANLRSSSNYPTLSSALIPLQLSAKLMLRCPDDGLTKSCCPRHSHIEIVNLPSSLNNDSRCLTRKRHWRRPTGPAPTMQTCIRNFVYEGLYVEP